MPAKIDRAGQSWGTFVVIDEDPNDNRKYILQCRSCGTAKSAWKTNFYSPYKGRCNDCHLRRVYQSRGDLTVAQVTDTHVITRCARCGHWRTFKRVTYRLRQPTDCGCSRRDAKTVTADEKATLRKLRGREREDFVVLLRSRGRTLRHIGAAMGITKERARQLEKAGESRTKEATHS